MTNRLIKENSPYLLQHAENPVDWFPWGDEALQFAEAADKPIFLSVGYAACHWCHVMAHESFEDPVTATIMNENFVNIKVDREERPDIDAIYMKAVVAMTGQGGWPMSVFLTPDGKPFYGGTYFPPTSRFNLPSFQELCHAVARLWAQDRDKIIESSTKITQYLVQNQKHDSPKDDIHPKNSLNQAVEYISKFYDWTNGGWGRAPKFPQPMIIEFLLRRRLKGDNEASKPAYHALRAMAKGGVYDLIGGGFARYSVDDQWLTPHFEKMLYDNAQLASVYLHAYLITGDNEYRRICENTLDFVLREMTHPMGGFFSSLDADSDGFEGMYYLWTPEEIKLALEDPQDFDIAINAYGITKDGNFEGKNILHRALDNNQIAEKYNLPVDQISDKLDNINSRLLKTRLVRTPPAIDDKVIVVWNALIAISFSEAGRYLRRKEYTQAASRNLEFLISNLYSGDRLSRSWRAGHASQNAFLEDYASLILALLSLYQSDEDVRWYKYANKLTEEMETNFLDPSGGFYDTRHDHESLLFRPKELQDNPTPSGNALAAMALLQSSAFSGDAQRRKYAEDMITVVLADNQRSSMVYGYWLCAEDFVQSPSSEIALLYEPDNRDRLTFIETLWSRYRPDCVAAISVYPPPQGAPKLLNNRNIINSQPTAYICHNFVCRQPVNTIENFIKQLDNI